MSKNDSVGVISANEAYSKQEVLSRFKISQSSWDKMLDAGLPYSAVGKTRWVTGKDLIEFLNRNTVIKNET